MSGGSFNYLCWKNDFEIVSDYRLDDLESMVDTLRAIDIDSLAYKRSKVLLDRLREIHRDRDKQDSDLREVWKAVEWWHSGDYSRESAVQAVKDYEAKSKERQHNS